MDGLDFGVTADLVLAVDNPPLPIADLSDDALVDGVAVPGAGAGELQDGLDHAVGGEGLEAFGPDGFLVEFDDLPFGDGQRRSVNGKGAVVLDEDVAAISDEGHAGAGVDSV